MTIFSDLGSIAIGLKCSDIMDLEYYDVSESITSIYSSTDLKPDMVNVLLKFFLVVDFITTYIISIFIISMFFFYNFNT